MEFNVVQTSRGFRNEIGEMSETEVYAHVRTRLGDHGNVAENALAELAEWGLATVQFKDGLGMETLIEIRRI